MVKTRERTAHVGRLGLEDNEDLEDYVGRPLLAITYTHPAGSHLLIPDRGRVGVVIVQSTHSFWVQGPRLTRIKGDVDDSPTHRIFGIEYIYGGGRRYGTTPVPIPQTDLYAFFDESEGREIIEKIVEGSERVIIQD